MTEINEILVDVLHCLPCLQVNVNREVDKRHKNLIEAGDYWLPKVVTIGMLKSFDEEIDFDRLTKHSKDYWSWEDDRFEALYPLRIIPEIETWRINPSDGFQRRDFELVRLVAKENENDTHLPRAAYPCSLYCSPNCPNKTDPQREHLCTLDGLVTAEEVLALLSYVQADHWDVQIDASTLSTELIGRILRDERVRAAKTLEIGLVHGLDLVEQWGTSSMTDHVVSYFCSAGNEQRVLFLEQFGWDNLFADLMLRIIVGFLTAPQTKDFCRMMFAEIDEDTRELAVAHLMEAGQARW